MVEGPPQHSGAKSTAQDPLLGKVLNGRFTILETLGAGGMGKVYKAIQAPLDRVVALKVLNPNYGGGKDPGFQKRFFLEASMTSKLHHPNTITVIDYGKTEEGIFYLAMEFVEGQTLARLITEQGPLPWPRAMHIAQQICRSLREAHKHGIIHRDLKPANVMILNEETDHDLVKVLDFGLVKSFLPEARDGSETELTQAGVLLGSPLYMAPEQARNLADPRSDVYSLGVVFYQMLAGKPPFQAKDAIDVIVKHVQQQPPPIKTTNPNADVTEEVDRIVMRCLAKKPEERFQSMDDLLDAMRKVASQAGLSGVFSHPRSMLISQPIPAGKKPSRDSLTRADAPKSREIAIEEVPTGPTPRWRIIGAGIFVGAVVLGLFGVYAATHNKTPPPPPAPLPIAKPPVSRIGPPPTPVETRPTPSQPTTPEPVHFRVSSDPIGARVSMEGKDLGRTPLEFDLPAGDDGNATASLTFALDGYQRTTYTAKGRSPGVTVDEKLQPIVVRKRVKQQRNTAPGYKDDPYQ